MTTTDHSAHSAHEGHSGHGGHSGHVAMFRRLFWIMLALAVPTVLASEMFASIIGYPLPDVPGIAWISPVLGTVMYVWGGKPFLTGAVDELKERKPGMMLLVALAITVAFVSSWGASLGIVSHELDFWWELALLVVIMLLGHWIEMRSLAQSSSALESLAALLPDEAERVGTDGQVTTVSPTDLVVGDVVVVRPGGRVPADGVVSQGSADVDESMITGESRPVRRTVGDHVVAGTVATDQALRVTVDAVGDDTALAGIQRLVTQAQESSSHAQRLADRAAGWLFWFALGAAVLTLVAWTVWGTPESALIRTITVLVIACPHALGLAIPLVVSISTERAATAGVLVKDRMALEQMRTVDAVLFDKTGTLTKGEPVVTHLVATSDSEDELLALAAAVEADSQHPLARAIVGAAADRGVRVPRAEDFQSSTAVGVSGLVDGRRVAVGGPSLLREHGLDPVPDAAAWEGEGATVLHALALGSGTPRVLGAFALADEIRPESREAVDALHRRNIRVVMITGDAQAVAQSVADELGIDEVFAGVRPGDKGDKVSELQARGHKVAMVGDGVNDAPALAQADVGIAIGAGTDVAIASAGVVLASDDPRSVLSVIELSRASYRKMKQNLWWAAGYNLVSVPLAAGVLAPVGFVMPMAVGALLMSLSTVIVALNAQLLRRLDLDPERVAAS
ncbi:heavy metal translocating P-type ATPase [Oerskovia turbata]|uniref:Heavy metal translocating P-type ATPase n=2 Tax=Oerskovia turbata TaxID=1713 RepID=A0A4Q1KXY4_9CELL|nr:heavy metal translocating P-type ATPase [Oerskovia turbata]RXR25067.1 heavy metal translocating P-type ATPase [Oerskovia turbata]RXR35213.1 heavy metal translocating P-type ATPase [Oerskovia turbata]TGJ96450.1 copper-translocating P-type ATPase [Actinotalea fermentans ATCC 43279 = JCM 9966 = DSM 3133]